MMGSGKDDVVVRVAATRECGRRRFHCFVRIARHSIVGLNRVQQPASGFELARYYYRMYPNTAMFSTRRVRPDTRQAQPATE